MSLLRQATNFIMQSRSRAFGVAFVCAFIPLLGSISVLIAGLVTLRKGMWEGALILFAATAPFLIKYYLTPLPADEAGFAWVAIAALVVGNVLVWIYALLLRQYNNWSLILELSALFSIVIIGAIHWLYPDIQAWWGTQLNAYFTKMKTAVPDADFTLQLQAIDAIKSFATGLIVLSMLLNGLLQVVLARWWQVIIYEPGTRLRQELYRIRLGHVVGILFIAILLLSYWANNATALDARPVFYGLFFIAGLSVVHYLLALTKYTWFWLMLFYVTLIALFPKSIMLVAFFALLDVLLDLRRRLTRV